jgi:hypothetical protein
MTDARFAHHPELSDLVRPVESSFFRDFTV